MFRKRTKEQIDKLNALMELEIARKEIIHYIEMGIDRFAVSAGDIEIRKRGLKNE